jgi:hypothetical protein
MKKILSLTVLLFSMLISNAQQYQINISQGQVNSFKLFTTLQCPTATQLPGQVPVYMSNQTFASILGISEFCGTPVQSFPSFHTTNGYLQWNKLITNGGNTVLPVGNYWSINLQAYSNLNLVGNTFYYHHNTSDIYYRITFTTTLSSPDFEKSFSVYPNPARDIINIQLDSEVYGEIYNLLGAQVLKFSSHEIDISSLQSGVYLMKIYSEGMQCTKKIVKQ